MAPNPRVAKAFRAMKCLGIKEETVKPILKNLLKLYDKNWELIEAEDYRALADAIFDQEDAQATEHKKKPKNSCQEETIEEAQVHEEPERPLKRLRLRYQDGHVPSGSSSPKLGGTSSSRQPKVEEAELPAVDNVLAGSQPVSPQPLVRNKGKQPALPMPLPVPERSVPPQPDAADRTQASLTRRTRSDSVSHALSRKEKGKEPISPQIAPREKKSISEGVSHTGCLKEPKAEPGVVVLPEKKLHSSRALIKPKDEPLTDDMPQFEVPIAVIHPESLNKENRSIGNGSTTEADGMELLVPQLVGGKDSTDGVPASSSERTANCELATIVAESSSNLEIASSPSGEVKISLSCNSVLGRPYFHMPTIDAVFKTVEDKCFRSYKVLDPSFSVMKLMKDVCECFLELGTGSVNESQETIVVTPAIDLMKQSNTVSALAAKGKPFGSSNGSVNKQRVAEAAQSHIPRVLHSSNGMHGCTQTDKNNKENSCEIGEGKEENGLKLADSRSLVVVKQHQVMLDDERSLDDVVDIAKGQERVVISLINEVNDDCPPSFHYIPQNAVFQNAYVNFSLARIGENCCSICSGDCLSSSTPCACANETGGEFVYTLEGLVKEDFLEECISMNRDPQKHCHFYCKECPLERSKTDDIPEQCKGHLMRRFIKECWWKCGCSNQCGNRVVQRGINCNLQVFMTPQGKGWGLRTLEDLPKGAFVCEYVGEILTNAELYERISRSPTTEEHAYPVLLDADWGAEEALKDEEALCLDATHYGNVARFINHKCFDSNLVEIPVEVETPDHHYYHLAFFTTRKVNALEELTWDYGIDFDDHDHPVKAFKCRCGSKFCRNIKRSRSRSRR